MIRRVAKAGWAEIGGKRHYYRSLAEKRFALYLEWLKKQKLVREWEHEPKTFWFEGIKRGCVSYKPDFKVHYALGEIIWHEVKGYMDAKSKTKIKRFRKYFPDETLIVNDGEWFRVNSRKLRGLVPGWS